MNNGSRFWIGVLLVGTAMGAVAVIFFNGLLTTQQNAQENPGTVIVGAKDLPEGSLESFDVTFGPTYLVHANGTLVPLGNGSTLDLVALQGPHWRPVTQATVPSGNYTGILLTFTEARAEPASTRSDVLDPTDEGDPEPVNVEVPTQALRIHHSFEVTPGGNVTLLLDVDLPASVEQRGDGELTFHPVMAQLHDSTRDTDGDGVDDVRDWDDDGDGIPDYQDPDHDGDGDVEGPPQRWVPAPSARV